MCIAEGEAAFSPWFLLIRRHFLPDWWSRLRDFDAVRGPPIRLPDSYRKILPLGPQS